MTATATRRRCRDCGRPLARPGRWGVANRSGWCQRCYRRHRCSSCGLLFAWRVPSICAVCAATLVEITRLRRTWFGPQGECRERPPDLAKRIERLAERAAHGLPLTG